MWQNILRVSVISLATYGAFQLAPVATPTIQKVIKNPQFSQSPIVKTVIDTTNKALPKDKQISFSSSATNSSQTSTNLSNEISKAVTETVSQVAQDSVDLVKDTAHDQFCQALYKKVESECGTLKE